MRHALAAIKQATAPCLVDYGPLDFEPPPGANMGLTEYDVLGNDYDDDYGDEDWR